uniref:Immunoglobulin V-set domain-containing protein n=2 Tax=Canis lupus familiaris TaxID=9615 RepID=A0A8C0MTJ3_CANLF
MLVTISLASPQRPPPVACVSLQPREKGKWLRSRKWGPSSCKEGDATEADWSPRGWRTPTAFGLLGWVVLCLLGAGPVEAGVTQTLRYLITGTRRQLTLLCSQDMNRDAMYWYGQDPGLGLKLIYSSRNVQFTEKGDVPDGYWVSRKEKRNSPLAPTLESAGTNHTSLHLCASGLSTALLSQMLAAQKGHLENKEAPSWGAPPQPRGELPPPSAP